MTPVSIRCLVAALFLGALVSGCGSPMLKTKGRVVKDGATFVPGDGEVFRVTFVPILKEGAVKDLYAAEFDGNGVFTVAGKDLRGMPPGKYRAAIEYRGRRSPLKDGNYDDQNSPFVFDVDSRTKEIVIDLDRPPQ
jgi:hypothetical protein